MTVVRETVEECGLEIEVERLVGYYHFRGIRIGTDAVYRAHPIGGYLHTNREALLARWTAPDQLPRALFPWYRRRVLDALGTEPTAPFERWQLVGPGDVMRHGAALTAELGSALGARLGLRSGT